MAISRDITGLLAQSGDPSALLNVGNRQSQQVAQSAPNSVELFNLALMQMLRQQQQLGTKGFAEQELNAQESQARRVLQQTPQQLIGASPQLQAGVRSAQAQALQPTIAGAQQSQKTFSEQIRGFENILKTAKEFGAEFAKISPTPEVIGGYLEMIRAGGSPAQIPDEVRGQVLAAAAKDPKVWQQWQEANRKGLSDQLSANQKLIQDERLESRAQQIAGQFRNEAVVLRYNTIAEGVSNAKSLVGSKERNAANDIALIYAFAKAMDPDSVVREGEYATVQKYAQSWLQSFGFSVQRIFANEEFLTDRAKKNMLSSMLTKYRSIQPSYQNVYNEYSRRIGGVFGDQQRGSEYLTDYASPYRLLDTQPSDWERIPSTKTQAPQLKTSQQSTTSLSTPIFGFRR